MERIIRKIYKYKRFLIVFYTVLAIGLGIRLYLSSGNIIDGVMNEQMLHRQQIVSRVASSNVNDFLEDWGFDLSFVSNLIDPSRDSVSEMQKTLFDYISKYESPVISGVIVTDKNGIVIVNANRSGVVDTGKDVSDREYFKWAKSASAHQVHFGEPVVSRVGMTEGREILPLSTPLLNNGKFIGVMTAVVDMRAFADKYFEPLKITDRTRIYLVAKDGKVIYSQFSNLRNQNYLELLDKLPDYPNKKRSIESFKQTLLSDSEGKLIVDLPNQETGKIDTFLVSYSPVSLGENSSYKLAIATPVEESYFFTWQIFNNQFRALTVFIAIIVGYAILNVTIVKISSKKAYERGLQEGRNKI